MGKKKSGGDRMDQWPTYLRGEAQNRHGGHQVQKVRAYRGNTYGAASACRSYTPEEIAAYVREKGSGC